MSEPEDSKGSDGFGLGKDARLEAKQTAEVEEKKPDALDSPFPYRVIAFDSVMVRISGV